MNTKTLPTRTNKKVLAIGGLCLALSMVLAPSVSAYTQISSTLDFGARGSNVFNLQEFLAGNSSIYPEALVTGYFGSLTRAAVQRFQATQGIVSSGSPSTTGYGRVGPMTRARINAMIASGGWVMADISGPIFSNINVTRASNSGTIAFNSNEAVTARVVYDTTPVLFNEGALDGSGFGPRSGTLLPSSTGLSTFHSIMIPNLNSGTTYYYTVIATDAAGNVSVIGPNNSFHTF